MPGVEFSSAVSAINVDLGTIGACMRTLHNVVKPPELVEVTLARNVNQEHGFAWLGFVTCHGTGWWERNGMAVSVRDQVVPRRAVVDLTALTERVNLIQATGAGPATSVEWRGATLIVGGAVVPSQPGTVPCMPVVGPLRDRVYMAPGANAWRGVIIETEQGRVGVPPPLVAHLQHRNAAVAEFGVVDGAVLLVAQSEQRGHITAAPIIVAPVELIAWTEGAKAEEVRERRQGGREVEQLLTALDPETPVAVLLELLDTSIGYIRRRVAAHPGLPASVIEEIAEHGTVAMRVGVAANPALPETSVRRLVSDPEVVVRTAVATNEQVGPELVAALAWDLDPGVRAAVATNAQLSDDARALLTGDPVVAVRQVMASNPATGPDLLELLARDPEPAVCAAVAANPSCPAPLLDDLIAVAPLMALMNPNVSPRLLLAGSRAADPTLRARVAANPAAPDRVITALARDRNDDVLRAVVANPGASRSARDRAERRLGTVDA